MANHPNGSFRSVLHLRGHRKLPPVESLAESVPMAPGTNSRSVWSRHSSQRRLHGSLELMPRATVRGMRGDAQ